MGLRTAAAKLGFRLAAATSNKTICSSRSKLSQFTRSYNSLATAAATADIVEKSSFLYLRFDERIRYSSNQVCTELIVRPISFDVYDDDRDEDRREELRDDAAYRFSDFKNILKNQDSDKHSWKERLASQTKIARLGSKILFTVGQTIPKDIGWVDPSTYPIKFRVSSQTETNIKSFSTPKSDMRWGIIDGKIYCFDKCPLKRGSRCFEVLEPDTEDTEWKQLSEPPFIRTDGATDDYNVLFLNESRKILGWEDDELGVFCYDTTKPENGWIESPSGLGGSIPFIGQHDTRFVIRDNHPKLGDFNLMFSYDCYAEPFIINLFFISDECDSFQPIHEPIHLPVNLCSYRGGDSQFVHLGSKKFCLILHSGKCIIVLTFEYDVMVSENSKDSEPPCLEIKTRVLGRRFFYYNRSEKTYNRKTEYAKTDMIGAFLF